MATSVYAKNLAKALFEDALKQNELIKWLGEMRQISDLVKDASVSAVLQKPGVPFEEKSKLLKDRAGDLDPQMLNMVGMLADKDKLNELDDVSMEYQRLMDAYHGVEGAERPRSPPLSRWMKRKNSNWASASARCWANR